jgi:decaprenyl-phosphate phosphoribosyltransferase
MDLKDSMKEYIKLMRPRQWFKSFYITIGAIPAILLMTTNYESALMLLSLSILNMIIIQGLIYTINDLSDVEVDRIHPKKKFRPIASGKINKNSAKLFIVLLSILAIVTALLLDPKVLMIDIALVIINLLYSLKPVRLKDISYLDVLTAAINFPLRVAVGWLVFEPINTAKLNISLDVLTATAFAEESLQSTFLNIPPRIIEFGTSFSTTTLSFISIMLFTYFTATFLLTMKRLAEKTTLENPEKMRPSLQKYTLTRLKVMALFSSIIMIASASIFAMSFKTTFLITIPLLIYFIFWYYKLAWEDNSEVAEPEKVFTKNKKFLTLFLLTIVATVAAILL